MIHPMIRYGFLVYHQDLPLFLERLRELGLVDITTKNWAATDEDRELLARSNKYRDVAKAMKSVALQPDMIPYGSADEAVAKFEEAAEAISETEIIIRKAGEEIKELGVWGDFDPSMIDRLRDEGIELRFFEVSSKRYDPRWEEKYPIETVANKGTYTYFVVAQALGDNTPLDINATEKHAPRVSITQKEAEIEKLIRRQAEWQNVKARAALSREDIEAEKRRAKEELDLNKAMQSGTSYADGTIKVLEGWSIVEDRDRIEQFARQQDVIYTAEDAKVEQNPPIKLKNKFFASLFEPIGDLYMAPRYDELDMTPFFAPFFMIFFGMCFADAGYGVIFLLVLFIFWRKIPEKFKSIAWLVVFLSISAVIFGTLTGNIFGIELAHTEMFHSFRRFFLDPNGVFYLAIAMGAVQVVFGQILRIFNRIRRHGSIMYGLSTIGWVLLMISSTVAFSGLTDSFTKDSVPYQIILGISAVLILFFNSPGKNPLINFGSGLYSIYHTATGLVSDLISYIRLFAIGLVGAVIAQVFNELAFGVSGGMPVVVKQLAIVVILLFGHGLNIFIGLMGSFVHPVRLTFVEFYRNAEFEGGGRRFNPFRRITE